MLPKIISKKLPGPKTKAVIERDKAIMSPSYTRDYPFVIAKGKGAIVYDPDGNSFLDFAAGIAVCSTGHCHPKVIKAIREQTKKFLHISGTDFYYEVQLELAEKLLKKVPIPGNKRVFWTNSGTEAVEGAMKLARHKTLRPNFVSFIGAFHGRTLGSLSLTASKTIQKRNFYPLLPQVVHTPYPYCFRCPFNLQYPSCNDLCIEYIENCLFGRVIDPESVAAIFIEPVQGEGGYIVPPVSCMKKLRSICDKFGIFLVADEVQCGMGRTGRMFAVEHFGISPDIICLAKGIASGMPLGGFVSKAEVMDWTPGSHGTTFGGNPVCCASALATLEIIEKQLIKNAEVVGTYIKSELNKMKEEFEFIGDVRGLGLMIGVEIVKDKKSIEPDPKLRWKILYDCYEKGVLIIGCGPNMLRICPPLIINKKQADFALEVLYSTFKKRGL